MITNKKGNKIRFYPFISNENYKHRVYVALP